jgi:hypothetical protein
MAEKNQYFLIIRGYNLFWNYLIYFFIFSGTQYYSNLWKT